MAGKSSNSNTTSATPAGTAQAVAPADASNGGTASGASSTAGGEQGIALAPPAGERQRFTICGKNKDGTAGAVIATTNSPTLAYSNRCAGRYVIDHANGDREYDGKNPARDAERAAEKEAIAKAAKK